MGIFLCKPFLYLYSSPLLTEAEKIGFALWQCCSSPAKGLMPQKCTDYICAWHFSLPAKPAKQQIVLGRCHLKKKGTMDFIFPIKIYSEMKGECSKADTFSLFGVTVRLLSAKSHKAYSLLVIGHGHFSLSPFAFQSSVPSSKLSHSTLNRCTTQWEIEWELAGRIGDKFSKEGSERRETIMRGRVDHISGQSRQMRQVILLLGF